MRYKNLGRLLKIGTLLFTWGLICTVLLQIVCRFSWLQTPSWTEEASRLFFIYAMSFAAGLAMKNDFYVHLDMFYNYLGKKVKKVLEIAIPLFSLLLFLTMALFSVKFIVLGIPEKSPSMGFNMGIAFFSMFIMSISISYYLWVKIARTIKKQRL